MDTPLLKNVKAPKDLSKLSAVELNDLAQEIRQVLIHTVAQNGGHLAPNLGVVELTIALHAVFASPVDKLIWDVGHQSYIHKLLTGRREEFNTLRQAGGISGFPKREESPHDFFNTGHSSTSISAALGMAMARDLHGEKSHVVAVIGDGALTGGMAFEALNHAGHLGLDLIVVLNDNEMSIAENVGALAGYLSRMRTDPRYFKQKEEMEHLFKKIPSIGPTVFKAMERIKDSFKYLVVPGMLFEELGFTYLGPIDGHNIAEMQAVLRRAKQTHGPIVVHVLTQKGKGYQPAEKNPDRFHGTGPFNIKDGEPLTRSPVESYTDIMGSTLCELAENNASILAVTAAMPTGTGLDKFARLFPKRFFDVGIAEQHAVTMSAGLATDGFKPVLAVYSTFLQRAYDQVLHDVALQNLPVVFAIDRGGLVGEDGETHQGLFDFAYLRHIPNMVVMAPKDENELRHMLYTAVNYNGPISLRYPRGGGLGVPLEPELINIPIGRAEVLREGKDVTLIAVGPPVYEALAAAEELSGFGIEATVINGRFIKPLDDETLIEHICRTGKVLTIEEHVLAGGFGSAVLEMLESRGINARVKRIGITDEFVTHGTTKALREKYGLTAGNITRTVVKSLVKPKVRPARVNIGT